MSFSLQSALRTPKVTSGLTPQLQSLRSLEFDNTYSPQPVEIQGMVSDTYGRASPYNSVMTQTVGQNPLQRILVENTVVRPEYSTYLNVPEGMSGGDDYQLNGQKDEGSNWAAYDTMTGRKNTGRNNAFGQYAGVYEFNPSMACTAGTNPTQCAQAKAAIITQRTNNNYDYTLNPNF